MAITSEAKLEIFKKFGKSEKDTGNADAQIALFTSRITELTEHLKKNRKDFSTQKSLIALVGKRRSLLNYIKKKDIEHYRSLIKSLNLRK